MCEVSLIVHTAGQRDRTERLGGREHESLGRLNAPVHHIGVRWYTIGAAEGSRKVGGAQPKQRGELRNRYPPRKVGIHVCAQSAYLPGEQTLHSPHAQTTSFSSISP